MSDSTLSITVTLDGAIVLKLTSEDDNAPTVRLILDRAEAVELAGTLTSAVQFRDNIQALIAEVDSIDVEPLAGGYEPDPGT